MPREGDNAPLSARDLEFLQKIADGISSKELAWQSGLSQQVMINALSRATRKLGANDRTHAVAIALRKNLIR